MRATLSAGRLAGARVGAHWSVSVVVAVLALGLALRFRDAYPGRPGWAYVPAVAGCAAALLLSLLAHGLGHAVAARRRGVEVVDVTLWLLGGVARMRGEAGSPAAERRIAAAGPLVSAALAVGFGLAAWAAAAGGAAGLPVESLAWMSAVNALLAAFTALPAAPLDGGRLLRAAVWRRTGDPLHATAVASGAGLALGWALIGLGLYLVVAGLLLAGFWLVVLGWFVVAMATGEVPGSGGRDVLAAVPVRQVMSAAPVAVPGSLTVGGLLAEPRLRFGDSALPVVDGDRHPVGLLERTAVEQVPEEGRGVPVASVMIPVEAVPAVGPDEPLGVLLEALETNDAHRVLVVEQGRLVGLVTSADVSRAAARLAASASWRYRAF
ncbi:site-2 protease family protein [Streptomyces sp. CC210A]|uniref:site-2 protease family protein n=1 Tax=Streptomyces sp. CC210A TaxID=2898184 RepID=UPI001F23EE89|nr:site-2 protease family protein [Streptomyces sp. CC210A]